MKRILLIPRIKVHNANALSSPFTIGFPAMTAWLGAAHALERKLKSSGFDELHFLSVGVVCHQIDLQTMKGDGDYVYSIIGTGNPLDKQGNRPSFIEEARCHLTVSLIIEYKGIDQDDVEELLPALTTYLHTSKMASGDVLGFETPSVTKVHDDQTHRALVRQLMPGHCLVDRRDLMIQSMEEGQDGIDALLDGLKVMHSCEMDEKEQANWSSKRKIKGWIVPIATGFHGISELGQAQNQRDPDTPHRFAESVVTLGEFVMPYRITDLDHMLWHYHVDQQHNLYLCQQNKQITDTKGE